MVPGLQVVPEVIEAATAELFQALVKDLEVDLLANFFPTRRTAVSERFLIAHLVLFTGTYSFFRC